MKLTTTFIFLLTALHLQGQPGGTPVKTLDKEIWNIYQDKNLNYWFGSNGSGLYRFDGKQILQFTTNHGLPNNQIRSIVEDKSGNLFVSTLKGICKFDGKRFRTLEVSTPTFPVQPWQLSPNDVWLSANGSLYRYDGVALYKLKLPKSELEDEYRAKYPNSPVDPYEVYSVYREPAGQMWIGTSNLGVLHYDGKAFEWITKGGIADSPVRSILQDKDGYFWFGNSDSGVYRYEVEGKSVVNFRKAKGIGEMEARGKKAPVSYMGIVQEKDGTMWFATYEAGIWRCDGKKAEQFWAKDGRLSCTQFWLYKDRKGEIWVGTHECGAFRWNGKAFEKFGLE